MKQIVYDAQTKETTIIDVPNVEMFITEVAPEPTTQEQLDALITALVDKGVIY